jgi:lipoate-protein ligase A
MAADEWLLSTAPKRPPVLRLYGWKRPAVSLGRNEKWRDVVNLERLAEHGVSLVRRPTGGRAVLHDGEITYSVTAPAGQAGAWSSRLESALSFISRGLVRGLGRLGVPADFNQRDRPGHISMGGSLCFESTTRYELSVGGVKAVGSAQCRTEDAFLQHGSIPVKATLSALWKLGPQTRFCPEDPGLPEGLLALAGRPLAELCTALASGFEEETGGKGFWQGEEILDRSEILALAERKYGSDDWTFRR